MDGYRQSAARKADGGRRRKRKPRPAPTLVEPQLIIARRPNSPLIEKPRRAVAASATPKPLPAEGGARVPLRRREAVVKDRTAARIVQALPGEQDDREGERLRLLERIVLSEGRSAISRAIDVYLHAGFELPREQEVQLQLLEHVREEHAREGIQGLTELLASSEPIKRPILVQRLRRIEEYADEDASREAAAALLRVLR